MTRRMAIELLGAVSGYLYGQPANQGQAMVLALDSVEVIDVRYRGRRVLVNPHELMDALGAAPAFNPAQQMPMPRKY